MLINFDIEAFTRKHITGRDISLFDKDLKSKQSELAGFLRDANLLVIGGAGSIGSSFIKAVLEYKPSRVVVVDTNENGLTELVRDLRSTKGQYIPGHFLTYPFNFGGSVFSRYLKRESGFDMVAHFAAHKHVRSEKDPYSIEAMIENNVRNTYRLLTLLEKQPPARFFGVSTDKASNPVNVMGATKKWMEETILTFAQAFPVISARFANVAFSNGSLLQGFLERIQKRQPLAAPEDIRRYFISPAESGQLCMLAAVLGNSGDVFFPKITEDDMQRFDVIARRLLSYLELEAEPCETEEEAKNKALEWTRDKKKYPVYFFKSDTSGEKPEEEFFSTVEIPDLKSFHSLGRISKRTLKTRKMMREKFEELDQLLSRSDMSKKELISFLEREVSGFRHLETGKNLDQRM